MDKKVFKIQDGITLIALVITIIVLLILAGIAISMLSGENGILQQAGNAKEETIETEDFEKLILAAHAALADGLGKVDLSDGGALETELEAGFIYLGEGLVQKDGKYYSVAENGTVTKGGVKVGDTITYTPPATVPGEEFNWDDELSGGSNASKTDVALSNQDTNYAVTAWTVLNVNSDGSIDLISENPTTGKVYLGYANGYNNAVKLLDDACDTLYGNKSKGIKGRSIKIEDIEGLMTDTALASAYLYKDSVKYGEQDTNPYPDGNYYPAIYANEKLRVIDGVKKETGLGKSEQATYYTDTANASLKASTSIQPYQTYWYRMNSDMQKSFKGEGEGTSNTNYNIIMRKNASNSWWNYWVASRCVSTLGDSCEFCVRIVYSGEVDVHVITTSSDRHYKGSLALRPVVSLNSDLLVRNADNTWSVKVK